VVLDRPKAPIEFPRNTISKTVSWGKSYLKGIDNIPDIPTISNTLSYVAAGIKGDSLAAIVEVIIFIN
jgi:hypothetical protein